MISKWRITFYFSEGIHRVECEAKDARSAIRKVIPGTVRADIWSIHVELWSNVTDEWVNFGGYTAPEVQ